MLRGRTAWNDPQNDITPFAEVKVFCQDLQVSASSWAGRCFWDPAWFGHLWPKQTQPFSSLNPNLISVLSLLFCKTLGRIWVCSNWFWNLAGCVKRGCRDVPTQVQRALLWTPTVNFWHTYVTSGFCHPSLIKRDSVFIGSSYSIVPPNVISAA